MTPAPTAGSGRALEPPRFSAAHMDSSVRPSEDFYRYATGRWVDRNPVPPDKSRWSAFDVLTEYNYQRIRRLLDRVARPARGRTAVEREVGDYYASAMDQRTRNRLGIAPLADELARVEAIRDADALATTVASFHARDIPVLFNPNVRPDKRDSRHYGFYLWQGGLSLPDREYYLTASFARQRREFPAHVIRLLVIAGDRKSSAQATARRLLAMETELARASRTRTELRDEPRNYNRMSRAGLRSLAPGFAWETYFRARKGSRVKRVIVGQPDFLRTMSRLLRKWPLEDWKAYLRWHLIRSSAPFLDERMEGEHFRFYLKGLRGQQEQEPAWKRAAESADNAIGDALGRLFVEAYFPKSSKVRMQRLVDDLRSVFRDRLRRLEWMTPATRREAQQKFQRFRVKIGHPRRYRDDSRLRIARSDYLGNYWRATEYEARRQMARVGKPVDTNDWLMTPPMVNAYFEATRNEIVFPAGILQPPFFDPEMDDAVNYGGIGLVIGHEITHGYDDQGRQFDKNGNLRDWWTSRDAREFKSRAQRVISQYDRFEVLPGVHVNGALTAGENIADLGGLRVAFDALQRRLRRAKQRPPLIDGLTPEQRFFVSYGQIWRQNSRPADTKMLATVDSHSPPRFRVQGAVQNSDDFYEAFGIKSGSPMWRAPGARVKIW